MFFGPHSPIRSIKVFVYSPKFVYAPQSRYPGAGPDLQIAKTVFRDIPPKC